MNAAKKAMIDQLQDSDPENVSNALFVLGMEDLSLDEMTAVSEFFHHNNRDIANQALMALLRQDNVPEEINDKIVPFLNDKNEDVQETVAHYIYNTYASNPLEEKEGTVTPLVAKHIKKLLSNSKNEGALFYALATVSDFEEENPEWTPLFCQLLKGSYGEDIHRISLSCLAQRPGIDQDTIEVVYKHFKNSDNPGITMMAANLLSQCEEAPKNYQKEAEDFFNAPDGGFEENLEEYAKDNGLEDDDK